MAELDKLTSPEFKQDFKDLLAGFDKLNTDLSGSATALSKLDTSLKNVTKSREALNKSAIDAERLKQEAVKTDSLLVKKEQEIIKSKSLHLKKIQEIKKARQEQLKIQKLTRDAQIKEVKETERLAKAKEREAEKSRKAAVAAKKQAGAYEQLNQKYKIADTRAKNLAARFGVNSREATKAAKSARNYKKQLDAINKTTKTSSGSFKTFAKGILTAGAAFLTFRAVGKVFGDAIKKIAGFEESMSKVKAVTGATDKEFKTLANDAKRLGSITSRSAQDVSGLQLEFAKLGFSTAEILNATEATISLSIAAGSDLAESAVVAASTVRGFGLSASETQRVVDVMAKSFASSALDLDKFKTAMSNAAPAAKNAGKDIEFLTAQMSVLVDNGVDASTAGTSLRNMFIELSRKGLTWEEGLEKINNATDKNVEAFNLFGKKGVIAATVLADNIDKAKALEKAYDGAAGSAEEMARIMEDNLIGDTKKLSSAWEGFILGLNKGEGVLSQFFRDAVQLVTKLVGKLEELTKSEKERAEDVVQENINIKKDQYLKKLDAELKRKNLLKGEDEARIELINEEIERVKWLIEFNKKRSEEEAHNSAELSFQIDDVVKTYEGYLDVLSGLIPVQKESKEEIKKTTEEVRKLEKGLKKINIADVFRIRKAEKKKIEDDWDEVVDNIESKLKGIADNPEELTIGVRTATQELIDEVNATIDDSPVSFWDNLLAIDEEGKAELLRQGIDFANTLFDLGQSRRDRELDSIRQNYDNRIAAAEGNAELQEALTRESAQKQYKIELEQAKSERNQALFNIALSTAVGAAKALEAGPAGIFLAALNVAAGLAQTAIVLAQPLPTPPQFDKGSKRLPKGRVELAEKRPEIINPKNGDPFLLTSPTITDKLAGAEVIGGADTARIMNATIGRNAGSINDAQFSRQLNNINSSIKGIKHSVNIDKYGIFEITRSNGDHIKRINNKYRN